MENDRRIQWQPMIEMLIVLVTVLGSTIPLYMHTDTKIDAMHEAMEYNLIAIREEMKDFHGRLCAIEERNKK